MSGGMQLLPDPLYSLPTDNTYILTITSTDNGRIFLAGKDGCLYEVAYQVNIVFFFFGCRIKVLENLNLISVLLLYFYNFLSCFNLSDSFGLLIQKCHQSRVLAYEKLLIYMRKKQIMLNQKRAHMGCEFFCDIFVKKLLFPLPYLTQPKLLWLCISCSD